MDRKIPARQVENIVLIGMPASGKSVLGRIVARRLKLDFVDMDKKIEQDAGKSISAIFAEEGEGAFRALEAACAAELGARGGVVISTGGGVVKNEGNMRALGAKAVIIFVDRSVEDILTANMKDRPLLRDDPSRVYALYRERIGLYRRWADVEVKNRGNIYRVAGAIVRAARAQMRGRRF